MAPRFRDLPGNRPPESPSRRGSDFMKREASVRGDGEIERDEGRRQKGAEQDENLDSQARSHDMLSFPHRGRSGKWAEPNFLCYGLLGGSIRACRAHPPSARGSGVRVAARRLFRRDLTFAATGAAPEAATTVVALAFVVSLVIGAPATPAHLPTRNGASRPRVLHPLGRPRLRRNTDRAGGHLRAVLYSHHALMMLAAASRVRPLRSSRCLCARSGSGPLHALPGGRCGHMPHAGRWLRFGAEPGRVPSRDRQSATALSSAPDGELANARGRARIF
jgi:hypothetical protein